MKLLLRGLQSTNTVRDPNYRPVELTQTQIQLYKTGYKPVKTTQNVLRLNVLCLYVSCCLMATLVIPRTKEAHTVAITAFAACVDYRLDTPD